MSAVRSSAIIAKEIVLAAARPAKPGEKISRQKQRASDRLHLHLVKGSKSSYADNLINDAWHDRAGPGQLETLLDMAIRAGVVRLEYASERTRGDDEFYGEQVTGMHLVNGNRKA